MLSSLLLLWPCSLPAIGPDDDVRVKVEQARSLISEAMATIGTTGTPDTTKKKALLADRPEFERLLVQADQLLYFSSADPLRRAIFLVQQNALPNDNVALEMVYRLYWQLGKLLAHKGNWQPAAESYQQARDTLETLRNLSIDSDEPEKQRKEQRKAYLQYLQPKLRKVYYQLVDLLLKSYQTSQDAKFLKEVIKTVEFLKQVELQNVYQDECLVGSTDSVDKHLDSHTAILYPVIFPTDVEVQDRSLELFFLTSKDAGKEADIQWLHDAAIGRTSVEKTEQINDQASVLLNHITHQNEINEKGECYSSTELRKAGNYLYNRIIKPVEIRLKEDGIQTLIFVPDGKLRTIPLIALSDDRGQFVIDKNVAVVTIPGVSLTTSVKGKSSISKHSRIFLGGIWKGEGAVEHQDQIQPTLNALGVGSLKITETQESLIQIQQFYPNSKIFIDNDFTIENITGEIRAAHLAPYTIVHFNTHAAFRADDPDNTFLLTHNTIKDPANKLIMKDLQDILRLGEERAVELLTLSACETAKGSDQFTDDRAAFGLAGIAFKTGAKSVLASLWRVEPKRTSELMRRFYQTLADGKTNKVDALQTAQRELMKFDPPPKDCGGENTRKEAFVKDWAPFILIGNWK